MNKTLIILPALLCAIATNGISAELNPLFQDGAFLQCGVRVPVWGPARTGEKIIVAFGGQKVATVSSNGVWKVWLANKQPVGARLNGVSPRGL